MLSEILEVDREESTLIEMSGVAPRPDVDVRAFLGIDGPAPRAEA
jgi:hypothetical protein